MSDKEEKIKLTDAQKRAIVVHPAVDRIVIAMAGSGKTTVLAEYYAALLKAREPHKPSEIVAITFTEKAARSMRTKLIKKLMEDGKDAEARELYSAPISTIHSFCANIVRENALVLGLDPDWEVLDEIRSSMLVEECLRNVMSRWRKERNDVYQILMKGFNWGGDPYSTFNDFYWNYRSKGIRAEDLSSGPNVKLVFNEARSDLLESIDAFIDAIEKRGADKNLSAAEQRRVTGARSLKDRLDKIVLNGCTFELASEIAEFWKREKMGGQAADSIKGFLDVLKKSKEDFVKKIAYIAGNDLRVSFVELIKDFEKEYGKSKDSESGLDYDDLQDRAIELIQSYPIVRERIRNRVKALLVDEFQDINPVQMTLIELIRPEGRFFAVGDPRQSIYGFRYADVSIMLAEIDKFQKSKRDVTPLDENFRSRQGILDFVNELFKDEPIDTKFENFNFGCITSGRKFAHEGVENPVEIIISAGEKVDEVRLIETGAVARRLVEILNGGMMVEEKNGTNRAVRPSDMAILFRTHSNIIDYSRAIERVGIPHHMVSSQGFLHQREIMDLVNFLELLSNPHDTLAFSEVLRAPFCGITIDGLFRIINSLKMIEHHGTHEFGELFWMRDSIALAEDDSERWNDFRIIFPKLLEKCFSLGPLGRLHAILEMTHFRGASAKGRGGRRRLGNIGKLLDFAGAWEKDFPGDNKGFVSRMKELRFREAREGEVMVSAFEDSVALMSIHAAKGLEFPVVLFADAAARSKTDTSKILLTPAGHVLVKKRMVDEEQNKELRDFYFERERKRRSDFEDDEAKRVLYVALTRAMEKLILSFSIGESMQGQFYEFFEKHLHLRDIKENRLKSLGIGELKVPILWGSDLLESPPVGYSGTPACGEVLDIAKEAARIEKGLPRISNLEEVYSVTAFSAWLTCPRRMSLRYIYDLGGLEGDIEYLPKRVISEEEESGDEEQGGGHDEFPVMERGTIIHKMLFELARERKNFRLENFINMHKSDKVRLTKGNLEPIVDFFINSEIGRSLMDSPTRYLEKSFIFGIQGCASLFKAIIDAVWVSDGKLRIVDYKTGKAHDVGDLIGRAYEEQVRMYVRAIQAFLGTDVDKASLLYVDEGFEYEVDISENAMSNNMQLVMRFIDAIENDYLPPEKSGECEYCNFRDGCDLFKTGE